MNKYAGVVVLYNPEEEVVKNIESYLPCIERLYVLDNSEEINNQIYEQLNNNSKIEYVNLMGNKGLAYALNVGCHMAISEDFDYVLTMDQDSLFMDGAVKNIIQFIENTTERYTIIAANAVSIYNDEVTQDKKIAYTELNDSNEECNWVMTSGSMMSLKDYSNTNGFDEEMFIAHIDIDLCIQFFNNGCKIIKLANAKLYQQFGNSKPRKILWKTVHPSYANAVRTYYLFRNQKYLEMIFFSNVIILV